MTNEDNPEDINSIKASESRDSLSRNDTDDKLSLINSENDILFHFKPYLYW